MSDPIFEIRQSVQSGDRSAESFVQKSLDEIQKLNPELNAFISVFDRSLEMAREFDKKSLDEKKKFRMAGVPVGIKDLLCFKGERTTAGSKMLDSFVAPYSARVVEKLLSEGAIPVGKTNLDEFAMGSSNETSFYGSVKNPFNSKMVAGGSSGGSAAAVGSGMVSAAIGTDTGGSIRQPASFCNVVGFKPTYGRVSRYGIIAFASSLDQAGPMTQSVKDAALIGEIISGHHHLDGTSAEVEVPVWSEGLSSNLKGMNVGLPSQYFGEGLGDETRAVIEEAKNFLKDAGAKLIEVELPLTEMAVPVYYLVSTSEASSNLARYDGVRYGHRSEKPPTDLANFYCNNRGEGFGEEVKRRILLGTYCLSSGYYDAYYQKASQVRRKIRDEFLTVFSKCDLILGPVSTDPAFGIGEKISDPIQMYMNDIYTTPASLAGLPAMSVPTGMSRSGLPIGAQLIGPHFEEQKILNAGLAIEERATVSGRTSNGSK